MRLRTAIKKPRRYRENHNLVSHHPNTNKDTIPAYPELLSESTINGDKKYRAAAFPSLSLKRPRSRTGQNSDNRVSAKTHHSSAQSRPFMSLHHQNGLPHQVFVPPINPRKVMQAEDSEMTNEELLDQGVIDGMQTSPISFLLDSSDVPGESKISWDGIEIGLQLYIFDSLLQQFQHPEVVAEILGLDSNDLRSFARIKNGRVLRSETTEDLWDHCRLLDDETKSFIDPQVLQRYIDYFAYVSQFEVTSVVQRRTAVVFLRQRQIEGPFVEALLQDETGIWTRPDYREKDQSYEATMSSMFTYNDEAEWGSVLTRILVHGSHNLDMVTSHFRSCYFPSIVRDDLLTKPMDYLNTFEECLMYGSMRSTSVDMRSIEKCLVGNLRRFRETANPISHGLSILLGRQIQERNDELEVPPENSRMTHSTLYAIARTIRQSRLFRQKIEQMPLTRQQRDLVLKAAEEHAESMVVEKWEKPAPKTPEHGSTVASTAASISSEQSITPLQPCNLPVMKPYGSFLSDPATSSSPNFGQRYSSATSPEPEHTGHHPGSKDIAPRQRADKNRSDTLLTNATLMLTSQKPTYRPHNLLNDNVGKTQSHNVDRHARASSEESYHTALDYDEDNAEVDTASRQLTRRSPSPPPWSPITEVDGGIHKVSSLSNQVSTQAITNSSLPLNEDPAFGRATPWKSDVASSRNPSTRSCQVEQQSDAPISQPPLEILSGIHEAATSPTPSPSIPSGSIGLSTDTDHQASPSQPPLPPLIPSLIHTSPTKPQKKKQKKSVPSEPRSQHRPPKAKTNLKVPMPASLAPDSPSDRSSSSPKKIRSDKGKKRGPYRTQKAKLAMELKVKAEAKARAETKPDLDQETKDAEKRESDTIGHTDGTSEPLTKDDEDNMEMS